MKGMITIRRNRLLLWVLLFSLAFLGLAWLQFRGRLRHRRPLFSTFPTVANATSGLPISRYNTSHLDPQLVPFWVEVSKALADAKPPSDLPKEWGTASVRKFTEIGRWAKRPDLIKIPQNDVDALKDAHRRFVAQIPRLAAQLPYVKGSRGVVTTAASEFLPVLVVALRMLRRTGSRLPIQVFIESKEQYEREVCEEVLPMLNATCFLVEDVLGKVPGHGGFELPRFQLRVLAMLFSTFEEVVLLDADNIVVGNPEQWLSAEFFMATGFVSWPDYVRSLRQPIDSTKS